MDLQTEEKILEELLSFKVPIINQNTRFWMIRTQKGYFYQEFLTKKYVAIAWNNIDENTDFSENVIDQLKDDIVMNYPEIKRPSTVISKCNNFINEINTNDILVIPSRGSKYITFAAAGDYFEDVTKTVSLEKTVIYRIKNNDVDINDVSCPYKKRRHITLLRTIRSDDVNYSLYRALSNYHGISNFDSYARQILNELYNFYIFNGDIILVYNIRKSSHIRPRELSELIYGNVECLSQIIPEDCISTQISLHSPGDAVYILEKAYEVVKNNWFILFGLLVFLGGGSALSFKVNGLIEIIKNIVMAPLELKQKKLEIEEKELNVQSKRLEIYNKFKESGIDPNDIIEPLTMIHNSAIKLKAEPIILSDETPSIVFEDEEISELNDIDTE